MNAKETIGGMFLLAFFVSPLAFFLLSVYLAQ